MNNEIKQLRDENAYLKVKIDSLMDDYNELQINYNVLLCKEDSLEKEGYLLLKEAALVKRSQWLDEREKRLKFLESTVNQMIIKYNKMCEKNPIGDTLPEGYI